MNQLLLNSLGIEYDEGLSRFCGNALLYEKSLQGFLVDSSFAELQAALDNSNVDAALSAAHTLKGLVGNLSINRFYYMLFETVEALRDGKINVAKQNNLKICNEYYRLCEGIEKALQSE